VRLLIVLAVLGVVLAGAGIWLYRALPRIAAAEIGRLINGQVETGAFYPHRDGSVTVTGLAIRPRQGQGTPNAKDRVWEPQLLYDDTILRADHVYAKFSRRSLLSLSPRVTAIGIEDFLLDAQLNLNTGRWNIGSLRFNASRNEGGAMPVIRLVRGKLRYCKISGVKQEVVMSIPVEVQFEPSVEGNRGYRFEVRTAKLAGGYGQSNLTGHWLPCRGPGEPGELTVAGGLSSTDIPSLERAWAVDVLAGVLQYTQEGNYTLNLSLKDVHGKQAPEVDMLRFIAPAAVTESGPLQSLQKFFAEYQPTGTVESITLKTSGNSKRLAESQIDGKLVCKDISVCDSEFPYRLDHLTGALEFTESTVRANRLLGRHGPVEVCIDGSTKGLGADCQYRYQITSRNMVLDQALYAALSPEQRRLWDTFKPTGKVSVDHRMARTSPTSRHSSLSVDLNDVTAAFQGFPYPLAGLTGNLFFEGESVALSNVVSRAGGREIRVNGRVAERAAGKPQYYIFVEAKDIPLDATLRNALPARHRDLFRQFDANGLADIRARVFAADDTNEVAPARPETFSAGLTPASKPRASDTGPAGGIRGGTPPARVASAPESSNSVPSAGGNLWPGVSFLAEVSCKKGSLKLIPPWQPAASAPSASASKAGAGQMGNGPLVISDITAEATITPDSMNLRKLNGRHGHSPVAITGGVLFGPGDKLKQCHMKIVARQVPLQEAMSTLLPPSLAAQAAALRAEGDVDLVADLKKTDSNEPPDYAVVVECQGDKVNPESFGYPLADIRGTVTFAKDSIVWKNITATPGDDSIADFPNDTGQPASACGGVVGLRILDSGSQRTVEGNPQSTIRNPKSMIRLDGSATVSGGKWESGSFTLQATDVLFTESLGRALPPALSGLYRELSPRGLFDLDVTRLSVSHAATGETLVEFGGKANLGTGPQVRNSALGSPLQPPSDAVGGPLKTCGLEVSGTPMELAGTLEADGAYSTKQGFTRGHVGLAAERLVVKGKAVTHTNIAALYDPNAQKWIAKDFVGDCYGGKMLGTLEVGMPADRRGNSPWLPSAGQAQGPAPTVRPPASGLEYQLRVALNDVDLQQFVTAGMPEDGRQKTEDSDILSSVLRPPSSGSVSSGTMHAALSLSGRVGDRKSGASKGGPREESSPRRGVCRIDVADMQVGKVSPLGNVLSMLRLSEPTDYTFERMQIDSYIRADKLLISKLDLSGRNAAFTGSGTMDLPTEEINLTLAARGPRVAAGPSTPGSSNPMDRIWEPLQSLTEGLGGAVVRMEVTGTASNPHVQTKALPVIEDSLRILGTPDESRKSKK
jgi:hypothetical protein